MMGGFGSGRPGGFGRNKVESVRSIDVNRLHKAGCLTAGYRGGWAWKRDGEQVAWISMHAESGRLILNYRYRRNDEEWQGIDQPVPIVRVPCRFGGARPYFSCPGVVNGIACGRRVAKLYGAGPYFLCRHCYRLAYASQSEDDMDRSLRKANRIKQRLGGEAGMWSPFPERPKGMWRQTYERLRLKAMQAELFAEMAFADRAERLLLALDKPGRNGSFWP